MTQRYSAVERACLGAVNAVMRHQMLLPPQRAFYRTFPAEVISITDIATHLRRLTLSGDGFTTLELTGPDEYCGLLMPPEGKELVLPPGAKVNPRSELSRMPEEVRPELRWYTVRHHRPEAGEVDLDIVKHGGGPGEEFMRRVKIGDQVGFREGVASFHPQPGRPIIIGDETAAPAIGAILESLPPEAAADVFIEAPDPDYLTGIGSAHRVTRLFRGGADPGTVLHPALAEADLPSHAFGWIAGELTMVKETRRWLVERGTHRKQIAFGSYWILGRPRP